MPYIIAELSYEHNILVI